MVAKLIAESGAARVCRGVRRRYEESLFLALLGRFFRALGAKCRESLLLGGFCREGVLSRAWSGSLLCRLLTLLLSLPGLALHALVRLCRRKCEESVILSLVFEAGDGAAIAESWLLLLLWCIPFEAWDNAYHLLAFVLVLGLLYLRTAQSGARLRIDRAGFWPVLLAAAVFLAVPFSLYPDLSARYLRYHVIAMLAVVVTVSAPRGAGDLKRLAAAASGAVFVSAVYAVVQRCQGVEVVASYVDLKLNAGMPGRVTSFFDNPNTYAQVLVLLLPLAAALAVGSRRHISRLAAAAAFVLGVLALGMTYSRSGWIGLAVSAGVFLVLWKPKLIPPLVLLSALCVPLLPETILNRILTIGQASQDTSVTSRFPLYQAGASLIAANPVSGVGLGTDAVRKYIIDHRLYSMMVYFAHLHDVFLQLWAETGVLGFLGFTGGMVWGLKRMTSAASRPGDATVRLITAAACAGAAGCLVIGLVDYIWHYPRVMGIFWFVFALGLAGVRLLEEARSAPPSADR